MTGVKGLYIGAEIRFHYLIPLYNVPSRQQTYIHSSSLIRNYWRGFFAAIIGAMCFAMLCVWFDEPETIVPHFPTGFSMEFPYDPQELIIFTLVGVVCGFGGALYVFTHRKYVLWMRGNKKLSGFLQKNRFIYPFCISFLIAALTFPAGPGAFQVGFRRFFECFMHFFDIIDSYRATRDL